MGDLIPFDDNPNSVPAHLREHSSNDDLSGGVSSGYPIVSIKGKRFSVSADGARKVLMSPNDDETPASYIDVVVVKANKHLSKVFYKDGYTEGDATKPDCYSNDGLAPAHDVEKPQCHSCDVCPMNVWGSKITDSGAKTKACSDSRRLAIATPSRLDRPMLLRIPAGSLKELASYARGLAERGAPYHGVVTRIKFDDTVAHPRLTFKPVAWLSPEQFAEVEGILDLPQTNDIIGIAPAHVSSSPQAEPPKAAAKPEPKKAAEPKVEKPKKTVEDTGDALGDLLGGFDD